MENIEKMEIEQQNNKRGKRKWVIILTAIVLPILILSLLYFNNMSFKLRVNNLLSRVPGGIGDRFKTLPTDFDSQEKKAFLADYYLSLEPADAADKLYIIKKDDEQLYSEIIRLMNSNSSSKTGEIITLVRSLESRKDLLSSIYDEVQAEKEKQFQGEVSRLESQDLTLTIHEIENRYEKEADFKERLPQILSQMNENRVVNILFYIEDGLRGEILNKLDRDLKARLDNKLVSKNMERNNLISLASFYEAKPSDELLDEIGNSEKFSFEELGIIYKNLSILKSAEVLSQIEDDGFKEQLFTAIRREEELTGEESSVINDISRAVQFMTEYNSKIDDLVSTYNRMSPDRVARIVEKMMENEDTVTSLEINSEPLYEISDATIIVDVLSRMNNKTLSNIMDNMETDNASKLTQMLARP
ncbi:MAG: hypothetical protein GXY96_08100 [Tissierellia bacterium]|nr:hypothetical protein [Tissierellia bacterium]